MIRQMSACLQGCLPFNTGQTKREMGSITSPLHGIFLSVYRCKPWTQGPCWRQKLCLSTRGHFQRWWSMLKETGFDHSFLCLGELLCLFSARSFVSPNLWKKSSGIIFVNSTSFWFSALGAPQARLASWAASWAPSLAPALLLILHPPLLFQLCIPSSHVFYLLVAL